MFRALSAHLQEDTVVYMQHMVPSLSTRVRGGLSVHSCAPTVHHGTPLPLPLACFGYKRHLQAEYNHNSKYILQCHECYGPDLIH